MCLPSADEPALENRDYALLTEVLDKFKLDDKLRTSIIPDDLMRGTSKAWREIQRDNVPIKYKANEAAKATKRKLKMFVRDGFTVSEVDLSTGMLSHIPSLAMDKVQLRDEGIKMLAPVLTKCQLQKLDVSRGGLSDKGAIPLALVTSWSPLLTHLVLDDNRIGDAGAITLGNGLRHCASLQVLSVNGIDMQAHGFHAIVNGVSHRDCQANALWSLSAKQNYIADSDEMDRDDDYEITREPFFSSIHNLTSGCCNLRHLNVSNNALRGIFEIGHGLKRATNLTTLYLGNNGFDFNEDFDKAVEEFMRALETHPTLIKLDLSENVICNRGYDRLAQALPRCTTLAELNLWDTDLSDDEARLLAVAVAQSTHLTDLDVSANDMSFDGVHALRQAWIHDKDDLIIDSQSYYNSNESDSELED